MATDTAVLMDVSIPDDKGPWFGALTSNSDQSGPVDVPMRRTDVTLTESGTSPQGGIDYVDQAVGGVVGPRGDVMVGPERSGIRPNRHRVFNGDFIGTTTILPNRVQGSVGKTNARNTTTRRAISSQAQASQVPDDAAVVGSFLNPALAAFIGKAKGKRA